MDGSKGSRYRSGDGCQFSSKKAPGGVGMDKCCELPFGFVWTPLAPCSEGTISVVDCMGEALPPVLCISCLSYINMYSKMDPVNNTWECPLCGSNENVLDPSLIQQGGVLSSALATPIVEFRQQFRLADSANPKITSQTYILVLDSNLNREEANAVGNAVQAIVCAPKENDSTQIRIGLIVFDKSVAMYQLGISGMASADVCTIKQANSDEHLANRRSQILSRPYLATIKPGGDDMSCLWRCLSAVYGTTLSGDRSDVDSFPGEAPSPMSRLDKLKQRKETRQREVAQKIRNSVQVSPLPQESPWVRAQNRKAHSHPFRCTGEALQCAIDLATISQAKTTSRSQILIFTNGCPNLGDGSVVSYGSGTEKKPRRSSNPSVQRVKPDVIEPERLASAVQYFEKLSSISQEHEVGIDVFCTGAHELGLPVFQAMVEPSGGYVLPHDTFSTPHLKHNLEFVLNETFLSKSKRDTSDSTVNPTSAHSITELNGCVVDMRVAGFLSATHLVGSGELLDIDRKGLLNNERSAFAIGASLAASRGFATNELPATEAVNETLTRLSLGRFDPLVTLSMMLRVNAEYPMDDTAFFQCTVRYVEKNGQTLVTRVCSHQLPVAKDVSDFLESVDEEVVPVMLGKEAVYRSMFGREISDENEVVLAPDKDQLEKLAYEAQRDLDATIQRVSGAYRLLRLEHSLNSISLASTSGAASSLDFAFPPDLAAALRRLFHLRRGPLLSVGPAQSTDDRAEIRSMFLRLPLADCLNMMAPTVWSSGSVHGTPSRTSVPAETLSLWDNCIIAADHQDNLFVWSGQGTLSSDYDHIRDHFKNFLLERSLKRFPMPKLHMLSEGDSMSRRFTSILSPSHADPPEQQLAHFPALASLSSEELCALRSKFRFYDPHSDPSFRGWFWGVASAASASKEIGLSLCE
jgi:Sec23/Sec24 zinc finger/Sec23/Sec24 trunk domain